MIGKNDRLIAENTMLSKSFSLWEMLKTNHIRLQDAPNRVQIDRLRLGCEMLLQPLRDSLGAIRVNSALRSHSLNEKVGGSQDSDHLYCVAYDIVPVESNLYVTFAMAYSILPYRQLILYTKKRFIHVSYNVPNREYKREAFTIE